MNEQHTPGPWEWDTSPVDYDPEQEAPWLVSAGSSKYPDCAILQGNIKCHSHANARLIAAAPEMLDALRRAVLALAFAAESSKAMQDDYEAVSAAIEKATGASA